MWPLLSPSLLPLRQHHLSLDRTCFSGLSLIPGAGQLCWWVAWELRMDLPAFKGSKSEFTLLNLQEILQDSQSLKHACYALSIQKQPQPAGAVQSEHSSLEVRIILLKYRSQHAASCFNTFLWLRTQPRLHHDLQFINDLAFFSPATHLLSLSRSLRLSGHSDIPQPQALSLAGCSPASSGCFLTTCSSLLPVGVSPGHMSVFQFLVFTRAWI